MKVKLISPASPPTWEIALERFPVIIGRSSEASIQPFGKGVSDLHCEIVELNDRLLVRDLGSKSGTYVNGVQIDVATLMHEDTLTVSQFSFRVVVERPPSEEEVRYPVGLVTNYGPNRTMTSMVVATILLSEDSKPLKKKWIGSQVRTNQRVDSQISEFFESHDVQTVVSVGGNIGCLHEKGVDYPSEEECPFCHFWTGRQNLGP